MEFLKTREETQKESPISRLPQRVQLTAPTNVDDYSVIRDVPRFRFFERPHLAESRHSLNTCRLGCHRTRLADRRA